MTISEGGNTPERYDGTRVSANTFSLIGQKPLLGRDFATGEDQLSAPPVAILGYSIWKNRYGGDPGILGKTIRINEVATSVIGLMPEGMKFPLNADLWTPLVPEGNLEKRDSRDLNVFGRLSQGATLAEAQTEMDLLAATLEREYPKTNEGVGVVVNTYNDEFNGGKIRAVFLASSAARRGRIRPADRLRQRGESASGPLAVSR